MRKAKIKYEFVEGSRSGGSAQEVGEALEEVREANGGKLSGSAVVDAARSKRSCLHRFFEWDDERAGELYRRHQARTLISKIVVVSGEKQAPAYVSVRSERVARDEEGSGSYVPLSEALSSHKIKMEVVNEALSELVAHQKRFEALKVFFGWKAGVASAIDELSSQLELKKKKA